MIFQWRGGEVLGITQPEHARLAGEFARLWGNDAFFRPDPWPAMEVAATRHDDGHAAFEESSTVNQHGAPYDFITVPTPIRIEIFERCVDLIEDDPHAATLVSMHVVGLFLGRFEPEAPKMFDSLAGDDRALAEEFLDRQREIQADLAPRVQREHLMAQYRLLQLFDRLSLLLCMQPIERITDFTVDHVPMSTSRPDEAITVTAQGGVVAIDPYPFERDDFVVHLEGRRLDRFTFESGDQYRDALSGAPWQKLSFELKRPR